MNIYVATGLLLFGVVCHFLQTLAALEDAGNGMSALAYIKSHPYRAASMVTAAFVLMLVTRELGQLTNVTAVLIGYSCQSAADTLRARANARLNQGDSK